MTTSLRRGSASVDLDESSVARGTVEVQTHFDQLATDLAGVNYDDSSFIKIDLSAVYVRCLRGD